PRTEATDSLAAFLGRHARLAVLTGAGCSTASGIPDYRDDAGNWKQRQPIQFAEFMTRSEVRRRYWAQSFHGWSRIAKARPNGAHAALATLEAAGRVAGLITQNVDNLHRAAGSRNVIDLHGVLHSTRCMQCDCRGSRQDFQHRLENLNPDWRTSVTSFGPDGDATLAAEHFEKFTIPECLHCGGIVKPDVVFFGESVPAERVALARQLVQESDALLVAGTSLMVFSGFRFARLAAECGKPIAILNRGKTRADEIASHRFSGDCSSLLELGVAALAA
ncbi:MAG TPA: NAD-dependent protein deacetylase, partial [Woeseiaceae bacterium]